MRKRTERVLYSSKWWNDTDSVNDWERALSKLIANRQIHLFDCSVIANVVFNKKRNYLVSTVPTIIECCYFTFVSVGFSSNFFLRDTSAWRYVANIRLDLHVLYREPSPEVYSKGGCTPERMQVEKRWNERERGELVPSSWINFPHKE